jgi:DNA-binding transcriptional MerR regulator
MANSELTPVEVAREFRVSPSTVRRWEAAGVLTPDRRLPGSKHRRYSRAAVDALKKQQESADVSRAASA